MARKDFVIQHPETLVFPVMTAWATTQNYTVNLPLGCYYLSLMIAVDTLATGVALVSIAPYLNAEQTVVGEELSLHAIDTLPSSDLFVVNAGSGGYVVDANVYIPASGAGKRMPLPLPFGVRVSWNQGASTGATSLSMSLVAARDA